MLKDVIPKYYMLQCEKCTELLLIVHFREIIGRSGCDLVQLT